MINKKHNRKRLKALALIINNTIAQKKVKLREQRRTNKSKNNEKV